MEDLMSKYRPKCMDKDNNIYPIMKPKDPQLYCQYAGCGCVYQHDKIHTIYCNYYQAQSIVLGNELLASQMSELEEMIEE